MANRGDSGGVVEVTIFGHSYRLRSDGSGERLRELAALVDGKMREVAETTGTADSLKVAIMAALNVADDYLQARHGIDPAAGREHEARLESMVRMLDEALVG
jgi:cell division protein ZapA